MRLRFFDFEVFEHWWCCVFGDMPEDFETQNITDELKRDFKVVTSDDYDCRNNLLNMLKEEGYVMLGYNIKGYDLVIANAIYQGFTPEQVKIVNDLIINPGCQWDSKEHIRLQPFAKRKLSNVMFQDLMDDSSGTLKEKEATLGLDILESSVPFDKVDLTDDDKKDVIFYCKQDVYASMKFYTEIVHPYTETKLAMGKKFGIDEKTCRASTNARLVAMALGAKRVTHNDTEREDIDIPKRIEKYVRENLPNNIVERIRATKENFDTVLFDNKVSFGNGGIHSTYKGKFADCPSLYIESDDEYVLVIVDASSYYPSIMIQLDCLSRNVQHPEFFKEIFDERIALKHKVNKTKHDDDIQKADKLVLNTTFGASGNKFLDLYDPYMCNRVCKTGQLFLGAFANRLFYNVPTIKIIQTNTDGIVCYVSKNNLPIMEKYMKEWSDISGINMELEYISKIWQRDVNNYLMIIDDHGKEKIKRKGGWLNDDYKRPGYVTVASANAFACSKAAIQYLVNGKDIIESIVSNRNLKDFTIVCTKGPTYYKVVQRMNDGTEIDLFKANRVIATTDKSVGKIYKLKRYKGKISYTMMPNIPENCKLVNEDIEKYDFNEIRKELDYMYYIQRCIDLLDIDWYEISHSDIFRNENFKYSIEN